MRRVVVTGIGMVSPLGLDSRSTWEGIAAGRSGVGPLDRCAGLSFPIRLAAEVWGWEQAAQEMEDSARNLPLQTQYALRAADEATRMSGLAPGDLSPRRLGVYLGCGELFPEFQVLAESVTWADAMPGDDGVARLWEEAAGLSEIWLDPGATAATIAARHGAEGPHGNCTSACASSSQAIGEAREAIRRGEADVMLAGGAHSMIHPLGVSGFMRLGTLTPRNDQGAMCPFDRDRSGFVVGEGGAIVVLEELDHARRRGAEIWGEITGYGSAQDAYRVTDIHPEGRGAQACMRRALDDARVSPEDVPYVNAHGTSTVLNDAMETRAIKGVFGPAARRIWVSSTKSMLGHATTAGGGLELALCLLALRHGVVPPTANYTTPDPDCDLDYVPNAARPRRCRHILSNSFGFGGQNVSLLVSQC